MSTTPIITPHAIREYVRQQGVSPEAAPGLKMLMQAAHQIDELSSAAVKWQDQQSRIAELEAWQHEGLKFVTEVRVLLGTDAEDLTMKPLLELLERRLAHWQQLVDGTTSDDAPGEEPEPSHDMQALVDEACVLLDVEEYGNFLPRLRGVQELNTRLKEAVVERDRHIAEQDNELIAIKELLDKTLEAAGEDWQDVDDLPDIIRKMRQDLTAVGTSSPDAKVRLLQGALRRISMALGLGETFDVEEVLAAIESLTGSDNVTFSSLDASWLDDTIDLFHAVAGNMAPENRLFAKAARQLIQTAPRGEHEEI